MNYKLCTFAYFVAADGRVLDQLPTDVLLKAVATVVEDSGWLNYFRSWFSLPKNKFALLPAFVIFWRYVSIPQMMRFKTGDEMHTMVVINYRVQLGNYEAQLSDDEYLPSDIFVSRP